MLPPAKNAAEVEVLVHFSHPVQESALPNLFAHLGLSIDGEGTVTSSADGRTRTLKVDDKVWLHTINGSCWKKVNKQNEKSIQIREYLNALLK